MLALLLIGLGIAVVYFAIVWAISVRVRNYGFLDVSWSYGVAILAPIYAIFGSGSHPLKWVITGIGVAWSLRLGTYILLRVLKHHPQEDVRYQTLRAQWPGTGMFLLFFEVQAVMVAIFSLPFWFVSFTPDAPVSPLTWAAVAVAALALVGETVADWQMQEFKRTNTTKGAVCQEGLWRYSRHPNYFFESLIWWAFFGIAVSMVPGAWVWVTLACPLLMLQFLFKVTGIPLTEEYAVKSKGEAYREYQRTTSAFIPWFRKA